MAGRDIELRAFRLSKGALAWVRTRTPRYFAEGDVLRQFARAVTSVGANLEEARAAESKADFVHKCAVARKEAFEAAYWLRLLADETDADPAPGMLAQEIDEICSILTAIQRNSGVSRRRG
jgi:four helix bundle protein